MPRALDASAGSAPGDTAPRGVRLDGTVVCWGLDTDGQSTPPLTF